MKRSDYQCNEQNCLHIWELTVTNNLDDFPVNPQCPKCGSINTQRKFSGITFNMALGKTGSSKNDFTNSVVYHPSDFGKMKGKRIK